MIHLYFYRDTLTRSRVLSLYLTPKNKSLIRLEQNCSDSRKMSSLDAPDNLYKI